jgi:DNA repair protein RecO
MRIAIDGLVLRELNSGENDKMLLVLTAERGKIWISAKGGRSIKSQKSAICRSFTYAEFEIYDKNGIFYLSGGSPNKAFFAYKTDLDGYALASYITAICEEITGEEAEAGEILRATLNSFYAIENQLYPLEQIKAAYEIFAAAISGFAPDLSSCGGCHGAFDADDKLWLCRYETYDHSKEQAYKTAQTLALSGVRKYKFVEKTDEDGNLYYESRVKYHVDREDFVAEEKGSYHPIATIEVKKGKKGYYVSASYQYSEN